MKKIFRLFMSKAQGYLQPDYQYNHTKRPSDLIHDLTTALSQDYRTIFKQKLISLNCELEISYNGLGFMKTLSVCHLILMNSNDLYQYVQNILHLCENRSIQINHTNSLNSKANLQTAQFLKDKGLYSYSKFLLKCCSSKQLYAKIKLVNQKKNPDFFSFQLFFYIRNLFSLLVQYMESISTFARYFMQSNPQIVKMYADIGAKQSIIFYNSMINVILIMIKHQYLFLNTQNNRQIMKTIIQQQLDQIQGDIKRIVLNKYYNFVNRGLFIRPFKIENQQKYITNRINDLLSCQRLYKLNNIGGQTLKKNYSTQAFIQNNLNKDKIRLLNNKKIKCNQTNKTEQYKQTQELKTVACTLALSKRSFSTLKNLKNSTHSFLKVFQIDEDKLKNKDKQKNNVSFRIKAQESQNDHQNTLTNF